MWGHAADEPYDKCTGRQDGRPSVGTVEIALLAEQVAVFSVQFRITHTWFIKAGYVIFASRHVTATETGDKQRKETWQKVALTENEMTFDDALRKYQRHI
jgi:hypothetical protein